MEVDSVGMIAILSMAVTPFLSYFLLSCGVTAGWLMASREGVSGTRQLAHSSLFWPVIGTSYILHVPALCKVREISLYVVYYHTHSKNIDKCGKSPQRARRKPNYHTKCGKNCHEILFV